MKKATTPTKKVAPKKVASKKAAPKSKPKPAAKPTLAPKPNWDKKKAALRKKFPTITDEDIHIYAGESIDSVLDRLATKLGIPVSELS